MNLKEFVDCLSSPDARLLESARTEFSRRQAASKKLAIRLRKMIIRKILDQPNLIMRNDHFYISDPQGERFFSFVTPISLKRIERLGKKLESVLKRTPSHAGNNWWWHAKDLARFRLVSANLSDVVMLRDIVAHIILKSREPKRLFLREEIRDYIWTAPNERDKASKSIHFKICDQNGDIIEIQIMTLLQYSWDQIQHWLYEMQRAESALGESINSVDRSYWALSNTLFVLDEYIVSLVGRDPRKLSRDLPVSLCQQMLPAREN
jgi:Region found in RelA / SpoT proteins